jgi:diadenylate cyclase
MTKILIIFIIREYKVRVKVKLRYFSYLTFEEFLKYVVDIKSPLDFLKVFVDVAIVSYVVYKVIMLVKETRARQLTKGIVFVIIIAKVSEYLGFKTLAYILNNTIQYFVLTLVILFQPELRRGLEKIGRSKFGGFLNFNFDIEKSKYSVANMIESISKTCGIMSKNKIGSLIVIELETKVGEVIDSGVKLNSNISSELLLNIFAPNTPLHDGAVVIRESKIMAAACFLPLTINNSLNKSLGTRHRAALGISEISDAIAIVVSEETGIISVARNGVLKRNLSVNALSNDLLKYILAEQPSAKKLTLWKVKKDVPDK